MELEKLIAHEHNDLSMQDMIVLYQSLVQRGWIWQMPAHYQAQAVAFLNMGLVTEPKEEKFVKPKIIIVLTKDGTIENILTEGVIDVEVRDETGIAAAYQSIDPCFGKDGPSDQDSESTVASSRSE